ncbi:glutaminase, partial [Escherichia coli]|nr:glutaminase [Escherichia coli]EGD7549022.1 glutaminase [Escherichia coli]
THLITFNGNGVPKRSRFGTISKVCSLALATENIVLNTLQNKTGAVPTGIPF